MQETVKETYTDFHLSHNPEHVYPSEWIIRTLLGDYPGLSLDRSKYPGSKILDVGFGDGRNWTLLRNASLEIYGMEITEEILNLGKARAQALGLPANLKLGANSSIPFENDFFDYLLASCSMHYVDAGTTFADNLREYHRVLKPGGTLIATLPEVDSSIFKGSIDLGDGHVEICNDPWGIRNGYTFRMFRSEQDVKDTFSPEFDSFSLGLCCDNYYGIQINLFLLVCRKVALTAAA